MTSEWKRFSALRVGGLSAPLVVAIALLLHFNGRLDGLRAEEERRHIANVKAVLAAGESYRARLADMDAERAAAVAEAREANDIARAAGQRADEIQRENEVEEAVSTAAEIEALLPALSLTAIGPNQFATDSVGVRKLETQRLEARRARVIPSLMTQVTALQRAGRELFRSDSIGTVALDEANKRIIELEGVSMEDLKIRTCRILAFVPCPSRKVVAASGVLLGLVLSRR